MMVSCNLSTILRWTSLLWIYSVYAYAESCLQRLEGQVGAGNYTYYHLEYKGDVALTLISIHGDTDIYVSQSTLQPTYDIETHDLQSVTCGADRVDIPSSFKRPVGIGIYGHPSKEISQYELCVNVMHIDISYDYNSYVDEPEDEKSDKVPRSHIPFHYDKDEEEESLLWAILIGILKVFVEVFM